MAAAPRVTGLWAYQSRNVVDAPAEPSALVALAKRHGLRWLSVEAYEGPEVLDGQWLTAMRSATRQHGLQLAVHGYIGRPHPEPESDAAAVSSAIERAEADFAIVDAEAEYEAAPVGTSQRFVRAYRRLRPGFHTYFSSFGLPSRHAGLDWQAWADGGFAGMPQAYQNLNPLLTPKTCVDDWARFFKRADLRPTLGCFTEGGHGHLSTADLVRSVHEVPALRFNVYRHGTVTDTELAVLAAIGSG